MSIARNRSLQSNTAMRMIDEELGKVLSTLDVAVNGSEDPPIIKAVRGAMKAKEQVEHFVFNKNWNRSKGKRPPNRPNPGGGRQVG